MGAVLAQAVVEIGGETGGLDAALKAAHKAVETAGKSLQQLGKTLSLELTASLVAIGTGAFAAFAESAETSARLGAVLSSTGGIAGVTAEHINELAESLQKTTTFSADATKGAAALLLTFSEVRNEVGKGNQIFDRAIIDSEKLAQAMGEDVRTAMFKVGRALEDPVAGMMLLRRASIVLSPTIKEQIKLFQEHGDILSAQKLILGVIESKYKDISVVMNATPLGQIKRAWNEVNDALKGVGEVLAKIVVPLAHVVEAAAKAFKGLSPTVKTVLVIMGGAAASIGPVLLGLAGLQKLIAFVGTALTELGIAGGPVALVILALGALVAATVLVIDNWKQVKVWAVDVWTFIGNAVFDAVAAAESALSHLPGVGPAFAAARDEVIQGQAAFNARMKVLSDQLEKELTDSKKKIEEPPKGAPREPPPWLKAVKDAKIALDAANAAGDALGPILGASFNQAGQAADDLKTFIQKVETAIAETIVTETHAGQTADQIADALAGKFGPALQKAFEILGEAGKNLQTLPAQAALTDLELALKETDVRAKVLGGTFNRSAERAQDYTDAINKLIKAEAATTDPKIAAALENQIAKYRGLQVQAQLAARAFGLESDAIRAAADDALDTLTNLATGTAKTFHTMIESILRDLARAIIKSAILKGIGAIIKALGGGKGGAGTEVTGILFAQSGGFIGPGKVGVVGETGPELISGGRQGVTVTPLPPQMVIGTPDEGGGRLTVPVSITVQAIDSQDVARFFDENSVLVANAVLKAVQRSNTLRRSLQ